MATYKKICIVGNYSGRNAGDAALLAGALREISSRYEPVEFCVPTLNPRFIRENFRQYPVTPVSLLPSNGCIKLLGLPVWNAMRSSDLVLVTDAVLFDRGLFNPLHNYLSSLALLLPPLKRRHIPVVLYNVSLGPARTAAGRWCLRRVLQNSDLVILRDEDSKRMLDIVGAVQVSVVRGADSALSSERCKAERIHEILCAKGLQPGKRNRVGINLNAYGDSFVRIGRSRYSEPEILSVMSRSVSWLREELKAEVWLFATQHMDIGIMKQLQKQITGGEDLPLFTNREHNYAELAGLLSELDLLVAMRTHALILASSVGTPVVGLVTYPKTFGYLQTIGQEKYTLPIQNLQFEALQQLVHQAWIGRVGLRHQILAAVGRERQRAWDAAEYLKPYLSVANASEAAEAPFLRA